MNTKNKKKSQGRPKVAEEDKCKPNDRLTCDICHGTYIRACRSRHNKTKVHQAYENINNKLQEAIREEMKPYLVKKISKKMLDKLEVY